MTTRTARTAAAAAFSLLALTGCGTTDSASSDDSKSDASGGPVSIKDSRGKAIKLDHPAKKVVTLEWSVTEYTQALGVNPVGVADPKGYSTWDKAVPLQGDPKDVGVRNEPSVDAIAGLEPDLILADPSSIPEKQMAQMEKIAPVAVMQGADTKDLLGLVKGNQDKVGKLVGKEDNAKQLGEDYDKTIKDNKKKIADAGKAGTPAVFTYPYMNSNSLSFRMHGPGSASSVVGQGLGLKDAWTKQGDKQYGISDSDLEGLKALPKNTRFYYWKDPEEKDPIADLKSNQVWNGYDFVKNGDVHKMEVGDWLYGGTSSLAQFSDHVTESLTK